ncbi:MAG: hypothetical protein ABSE41_11770 [Bacteroidota bacterium]|jgi:hypothetical protein
MTKYRWIRFDCCAATLSVALMALTATLMSECQAQIKQTLRVRVNASPSVSVARMDEGARRIFADEMPQQTEMFQGRTRGADSVSLGSGFLISAYENITVLLSFTTPAGTRQSSNSSDATRITCGYLNDGTTYFRRATITNKNPIEFRLRNNGLLKRSMQFDNPLFVAYVFFLVDQRKEDRKNEGPMPVSTVTVEFM